MKTTYTQNYSGLLSTCRLVRCEAWQLLVENMDLKVMWYSLTIEDLPPGLQKHLPKIRQLTIMLDRDLGTTPLRPPRFDPTDLQGLQTVRVLLSAHDTAATRLQNYTLAEVTKLLLGKKDSMLRTLATQDEARSAVVILVP